MRQASGTAKAPVPEGTRAFVLAVLQGPRRACTAWGAGGFLRQRQRIDMIRPATMAPKPMAKFHAPSDTMNGMSSPAM